MNTSSESTQSRREGAGSTRAPNALGQIRDSARSLASEGKTEEAFDLLVSALDAVLRKSRELELMVLKLQRERVGKRSEKVDPGQLQLMFEQLMSQSGGEELEPELDPQTEAREDAELEQQIEEAKKTRPRGKGNKPRRETIRTDGIERQVHLREIPEEERGCSRCGKLKKPLGKDVRRRLEYVPGHFIEHEYHLEKYACGKCREGVTRAEGPAPVIERSSADASLLAHVVVSKYVDHVPLHRLHRIYARSGAGIAVSTMSDWVGEVANLVEPLVDQLEKRVLKADVIRTDATGVKVLDPQSPENIERGTHSSERYSFSATVQARPSNYWSTTARAFGCARSVSRRGACSGGRVRRRMALRRYPTRRAVGGAYLQRTSAASGDGRAVAAGRLSLSNVFW